MADATIVMDPAAVQQFVRTNHGVVENFMARGQRVLDAAKRQVNVGHVRGGGANARSLGSPVSHINLRDSMHKRIVQGPDGMPTVIVEATAPHAIFVHNGTRAHVIRPRNGGYLRWYGGASSGNDDGWSYATEVNHPGTRPNRFLTDNLRYAVE